MNWLKDRAARRPLFKLYGAAGAAHRFNGSVPDMTQIASFPALGGCRRTLC